MADAHHVKAAVGAKWKKAAANPLSGVALRKRIADITQDKDLTEERLSVEQLINLKEVFQFLV